VLRGETTSGGTVDRRDRGVTRPVATPHRPPSLDGDWTPMLGHSGQRRRPGTVTGVRSTPERVAKLRQCVRSRRAIS
jgi:hypothetical protein